MKAECINEEYKEHFLTEGTIYTVTNVTAYGFEIVDDTGEKRMFEKGRFKVVQTLPKNPNVYTVEALKGQAIEWFARDLIDMNNASTVEVAGEFNGINLVVYPDDNIEAIVSRYYDLCSKRAENRL